VTDFDPDSYKVPAFVAGGWQNARTVVPSSINSVFYFI
jgi:hypothetical protein